jgi:hypothetical protein
LTYQKFNATKIENPVIFAVQKEENEDFYQISPFILAADNLDHLVYRMF